MTIDLGSFIAAESAERPAGGYPLWHPMTDMRSYLDDAITIVKGEGAWLWDQSGRRFLSANSSLWNVSLGFGHPKIDQAIRDQLDRISYATLFRHANEPAVELAELLVRIAPENLTRVFYGTSGAAANEIALKLARRFFRVVGQPQRNLVIALSDSYHGTSMGTMLVTGESLEQEEYGFDRSWVRFVPTPHRYRCRHCSDGPACTGACAEPLRQIARDEGDNIAAIILEPILGSGGVIEVPAPFRQAVEAVREETGALLIVDEVATGFGRTGTMFATEWAGLRPDLLTLSKAINSGYLPLSATLISEEIFGALWDARAVFAHGETQAGNPLSCAAALATIHLLLDEHVIENAAVRGEQLREGLMNLLVHRNVGEVRGRGLMLALGLVTDKGSRQPLSPLQVTMVLKLLAREGLIAHAAPSGVSLFPPLVISEEECDFIVETLHRVLGRVYAR